MHYNIMKGGIFFALWDFFFQLLYFYIDRWVRQHGDMFILFSFFFQSEKEVDCFIFYSNII